MSFSNLSKNTMWTGGGTSDCICVCVFGFPWCYRSGGTGTACSLWRLKRLLFTFHQFNQPIPLPLLALLHRDSKLLNAFLLRFMGIQRAPDVPLLSKTPLQQALEMEYFP